MLRLVSESLEQIPEGTGQSHMLSSVSSVSVLVYLWKPSLSEFVFNISVPAGSFHWWHNGPRRQWIPARVEQRVIYCRICLHDIWLLWFRLWTAGVPFVLGIYRLPTWVVLGWAWSTLAISVEAPLNFSPGLWSQMSRMRPVHRPSASLQEPWGFNIQVKLGTSTWEAPFRL